VSTSRLAAIEVVEDRTAGSRPDEGFLRVRRLMLRNTYADGTRSEPYACDVVSRRRTDAVAVVLHDGGDGGSPRVLLRLCVRPPVTLRRELTVFHEERAHLLLAEIVAGVLEDTDDRPGGVEARAAIESEEEAGLSVDPAEVQRLGAPLFPSPGITDEKVHLRACRAPLERRGPARGDGSPMEHGGDVWLLPLREAIRLCREGTIPDMKTEVALLRLADHLGYVPALDRFVGDLPEDLRRRAEALPPLLPPRGDCA
jgi:ADP-ribose pyrophosphatase